MDGLGTPVVPVVAIAPPSVVQHQTADWSVVRADNVEGVLRTHLALGKMRP